MLLRNDHDTFLTKVISETPASAALPAVDRVKTD